MTKFNTGIKEGHQVILNVLETNDKFSKIEMMSYKNGKIKKNKKYILKNIDGKNFIQIYNNLKIEKELNLDNFNNILNLIGFTMIRYKVRQEYDNSTIQEIN